MAAIDRHASTVKRPNREIVGRIVTVDGIPVRYERLVNTSEYDFSFTVSGAHKGLRKNEGYVVVHSHPGARPEMHPSDPDLEKAADAWLEQPYAIYFPAKKKLGVYRIHSTRDGYDFLNFAT